MSRRKRESPVPRFLGVAPGLEHDPLAVLGLEPSECSPSRIEAALQRQLDRIADHPEAETPDADEVRLAVHTAAAQLEDPAILRALLSQRVHEQAEPELAVEESWAESHEPQPDAPATASAVRYVAQQEFVDRDADPNRNVRRVLIGAGIGVALVLVVGGVLIALSGNSTVATGITTGSVAITPPTSPSTTVPPTPSAATAASSTPSAAKSTAPLPAPIVRSEYTDPKIIVTELRRATTLVRAQPGEGLKAFRAALPGISDWWVRFDVPSRRAADDAVVEFLYAAGNDADAAKSAVGELASRSAPLGAAEPMTPEQVWPAVWSAGVLARLSLERDLPRAVEAGVLSALDAALGSGRAASIGTFQTGASAALSTIPLNVLGKADAQRSAPRDEAACTAAMKAWADACVAGAPDPLAAQALLLDGLERILVDASEPDSSGPVHAAIELIVPRLNWRVDAPARGRLLAWMNDPRVSIADLHVLTGALAGSSAAEGVNASLVLSIGGNNDDRGRLRGKLAQVWGLQETGLRNDLMVSIRSQVESGADSSDSVDPVEKMIRLVQLVRMSQAARQVWLGDSPGAKLTIGAINGEIEGVRKPPMSLPSSTQPFPWQPATPVRPPPTRGLPQGTPQAPPPTSAPTVDYSIGDGAWTEALLRAESNIPLRLQRLNEVGMVPAPLGPADAGTLVDAACFGSPQQFRLQAQQWVTKFASQASVVRAILERLPMLPKVSSISQMIERVTQASLPKPGDPDYELVARRALVERLLALMSSEGTDVSIDRAAEIVASAYGSMSGLPGSAQQAAPERALRSAEELVRIWRFEGERLPPVTGAPGRSPEFIERKRQSRRQIASGPLQMFAAEQVSAAEMFAYVVALERPTRTARVQEILDTMNASRRARASVVDQLVATERAIVWLWLVRLGEEGK